MPVQQKPFPNPPLALTVLEIRYPDLPEGIGRRAQQQMKHALRDRLPLIEYMSEDQVEVAIGAPMPASVQRRSFPRFTTRDRTTALVVKQGALILETTTYQGWEDFRLAIEDVIRALEDVNRPDGILRIGLRYLDEIRVPSITEVPGDWDGYIDSHLLAAASRDFMPQSLQPASWQGLVQYKTTSDSTLKVRYGPKSGHAVNPAGPTRRRNSPKPGPFFLLDSDSFWVADEEVPEFETKTILELCDSLHAPTREFFRVAVTEKLRSEVFEREDYDHA